MALHVCVIVAVASQGHSYPHVFYLMIS